MSSAIPRISIEAYGMDAPDNAEFSAKLPRVTTIDAKNPAKVADKLNEISDLLEEIHIKGRDNNAILTQMLFSMEERINRKIDTVREEMVALIDKKFAELATHKSGYHNSSAVAASTRNTSRKSIIMDNNTSNSNQSKTALASIFESVESTSTNGTTTTTVVPPSKVITNRPASFYETIDIVPYAGFVIKTRKLLSEQKEKVFINVFHHEQIEVEPANLPKSTTTTTSGGVEDNRPYLVMGEATGVMDKDGHNCLLYNVAVSTEYFKPGNTIDLKITSPASIRKIIHKINLKYNDFLDENSYSLPRVADGYKGEELPKLKIPVAVKPPPPTPPPQPQPQPSALNKIFSMGGTTTTSTTANNTSSSTIASNSNTSVVRKTSGISDIDDMPDNVSVVSELTLGTAARRPSNEPGSSRIGSTAGHAKRRMTRKSIFDSSQFAMNAGNILGRNLLSGDMLEYIREECIDTAAADELRLASVDNPTVLLGWQIAITNESDGEMEIFVITDVRKNLMSKTEYRLSRFYQDDIWMKLKRSATKVGVDFRPLRKVLFGLHDEDDDDFGHGSVA